MKLKDHPNWKKREIKLLAKTAEEYIYFQSGCLRFLYSLRFLQKGLGAVTESMKDDDLKITRKEYPDEDDFQLLRKKGSVPYSFYTSHECFDETELSPIMSYDEMKDEMLDERVYNSAKEIWDHFKIKNDKSEVWNHGQFIDLYLKN
jgi:hypothetical protein